MKGAVEVVFLDGSGLKTLVSVGCGVFAFLVVVAAPRAE